MGLRGKGGGARVQWVSSSMYGAGRLVVGLVCSRAGRRALGMAVSIHPPHMPEGCHHEQS